MTGVTSVVGVPSTHLVFFGPSTQTHLWPFCRCIPCLHYYPRLICLIEMKLGIQLTVTGTGEMKLIIFKMSFVFLYLMLQSYGGFLNEDYTDDLLQDCSNSSALALELLQSCTKPSICPSIYQSIPSESLSSSDIFSCFDMIWLIKHCYILGPDWI